MHYNLDAKSLSDCPLIEEKKSKATSKQTGSNLTKNTEQSSQRSSFLIQADIKQGTYHSENKPKIQQKIMTEPSWESVQRRSEVQKNQIGEKYRPHKHSVYQNVNWVVVVCAVEGEVPFKIKQTSPPHKISWKEDRISEKKR
ncbi:hypothetical protein GBA52_020100 [Prunus armeniaca]|nr:hypothetical protein GBA52_020100 [Prunus armeniaca]